MPLKSLLAVKQKSWLLQFLQVLVHCIDCFCCYFSKTIYVSVSKTNNESQKTQDKLNEIILFQTYCTPLKPGITN